MRYFIKLAYNGTNYHGWQIQPNAGTVQDILTQAVQTILQDKKIIIIGAGRTDTGVHARTFYAHFDTDFQLNDLNNKVFKLNSFLPKDIVVYDIFPVKTDAHSRFDAIYRTYQYFITTKKSPFGRDEKWLLYSELNMESMNIAARNFIGKMDFTSFSKVHTQTNTNFCTVNEAFWRKENDLLIFKVTADRFLRNMVRAMVGTLIDIGRNKINPQEIWQILELKDRRVAGDSVPAHGLFLEDIGYDFDSIKIK